MGANTAPTVSVIIASHRPDYVVDCVAAFDVGVWKEVPTELIVVADYPTGSLPQQFPAARWIHHPDKSIPAKRNRGIREARGPIIGFIDDDCRPESEWISRAVAFLNQNPDSAGVEGLTRIDTHADNGPSLGQFKRLESRGYRSNNIFYRRAVVVEAGLFDERFTVQREDIDLAFSIMQHGYQIDFDERVRVTHRYRPGEKWDLLKNCVNRRFDPLLHRKHPALYRRHIGSPWTPSIATILATHGVALCGAIAGPWIWHWAILDVAVLAVFTARRIRLSSANPVQWAREFFAYAVSPFVLLAALVHGSVRFRTPMMF